MEGVHNIEQYVGRLMIIYLKERDTEIQELRKEVEDLRKQRVQRSWGTCRVCHESILTYNSSQCNDYGCWLHRWCRHRASQLCIKCSL